MVRVKSPGEAARARLWRRRVTKKGPDARCPHFGPPVLFLLRTNPRTERGSDSPLYFTTHATVGEDDTSDEPVTGRAVPRSSSETAGNRSICLRSFFECHLKKAPSAETVASFDRAPVPGGLGKKRMNERSDVCRPLKRRPERPVRAAKTRAPARRRAVRARSRVRLAPRHPSAAPRHRPKARGRSGGRAPAAVRHSRSGRQRGTA